MTTDKFLKTFKTRIDQFRARNDIGLRRWYTEAGLTRAQLAKVRSGKNIMLSTAVELVRSASRILGRPVRVSELFDLGEGEPVETRNPKRRRIVNATRRTYATRFDKVLIREGIIPTRLAREASMSRQALRRLRADVSKPRILTVRTIVQAIRRMGRDIRASDIFDIGEEER